MEFVVHCIDHDDAISRRLAFYEEHKAYLAAAPVKTVISGPLLAPDGETMIGSLFVVDAPDQRAVEEFNRADPFHRENVWKTINIHPFQKRVDNRAPLNAAPGTS